MSYRTKKALIGVAMTLAGVLSFALLVVFALHSLQVLDFDFPRGFGPVRQITGDLGQHVAVCVRYYAGRRTCQ